MGYKKFIISSPRKLAHLVFEFLRCECVEARVFSVLLLNSFTYRAILGVLLISEANILFPEAGTLETLFIIASSMYRDVLTAAIAAGMIGLVRLVLRKLGFVRARRPIRFFGWLLLGIFFWFIGFTTGAHGRLLQVMNSGFTLDVMLEGLSAISAGDLMGYSHPMDSVLMFFPLGLFLLTFVKSERLQHVMAHVTIVLLGTMLLLSAIGTAGRLHHRSFSSPAADANPLAFFVEDALRGLLHGEGEWESLARNLPDLPHRHAYLSEPEFATGIPLAPAHEGTPPDRTWNFMIFILESVGKEYVFDTSGGNPLPMPFLKRMSENGLNFDNHFATGNTSPRAIFSVFTGLYPSPETTMFSTRSDLDIPSLMTHVTQKSEQFMVSPGRLESYFPKYLFRNQGFNELYDFYDVTGKRPSFGQGRNEIDGVDYFIERLSRAKEPYCGVYYSYAPHYPYNDYGAKFQILPDNNKLLHRYYNNLKLLDSQIERIYNHIQQRGQAENTVFMFIGDHGEAFGQHPGNYTHSRHSFTENYKVPAIIYQPKLFAPQWITKYTSHVDLLPTLLDALHIDYDPLTMQGESAFQMPFKRKYIFAYGNEGTLVSIRKDGLKMLLNLKQDTCVSYDLKTDPGELRPQPCSTHQEQIEALLKFKKFQPGFLERYNEGFKE